VGVVMVMVMVLVLATDSMQTVATCPDIFKSLEAAI